MVNITLFEIHVEDGSFSAALPFSGLTDDETAEIEAEEEELDDTTGSSGKSKGLALLGVFAFLVVATAAVRYLTGDEEEPEVEIDTAPETPSAPAT